MRPSLAERVISGVGGAALLPPVVLGLAYTAVLVLFAAPPDAYAPEADPCCTPPATWDEAAALIALALAAAVVTGLLAGVAAALLVRAAGRRAALRRLTLIPAGTVAAAAGVLAAVLVPNLDEVRIRRSCDEVVVIPGTLRTYKGVEAQDAIARCRLVDGASRAEVRARLGAPGAISGQRWLYGGLELTFDRGRVSLATFDR